MKKALILPLVLLILLVPATSGCATKEKAKEPEYERPYRWVEVPGSRVRKKVYLGEENSGSTAPVSSISAQQLNDLQNATRAPATIGGGTP